MSEINKTVLINTNSPRDSYVYNDDQYVIKTPVATNSNHIQVWLERQKHAKNVVDKILAEHKNTGYRVPKTVEISMNAKPFVREERVSGKPVTTEYFSTLTPQQKDVIYNSLAQFVYDMNNIYPVSDIISQIDKSTAFFNSLESVLTDKEITTIKNAHALLEQHPEQTPSLVFFHGDMNENNIFFDEKTNTVSILDFTEARYESAYYMFHSDLSRLPWLDLNKLISIYNKIQTKNHIRITQDKYMMAVFDNLRTIQNTGASLISRPQNKEIYKRILSETIISLDKAYNNAINVINLIKTSGKSRM